ncbi:hypothetical protein [Phaeocystidibacter marisrubri]|uniref:Uncharacterized protein n=1 Tax=Phaeocystidibacter marisrubri TaxID=1577780 RepID=A0A6L3ZG79_9FLAO|nr:hypothetical protein [Phaeocystidibacter marisrubri]KAB2816417.1 hypothetical protein F8C82_12100 [Phaeocystidibacter marisrubri]
MKFLLNISLFIGFSALCEAQTWPSIEWLHSNHVYSISGDSTLQEWSSGEWKVVDTLQFEGIERADFRSRMKLNYIPGSDPIHFTGEGTQQVYVLDTLASTFRRVDKTYYRGYNFNAIQWYSNDTLFSLGGYGFWHTNAILTYFRPESKEWEILPTVGGPESIASHLYQWDESRLNLYVSWSSEVNGAEKERSTKLWKLNLRSKKWQELGTLSDEVTEVLKLNTPSVPLPIGYFVAGEKRVLIDLVNNRMDYIDPSICDARLTPNTDEFNGNGHFTTSEALYNYMIPTSSNLDKSVGFIYRYSDFINARRQPTAVYREGWAWWVWLLMTLGFGLFIYMLIRAYKKLKQPFVKGATVQAEEAFFNSLDQLEVTLLRALLRSEMRGEGLKSGPITQIMGWEDKSWDNQRKWRNNLIKELNRRSMEHLNIEELIVRERDPHDKRERVYRLNPDGFRLLRDSLHFTQ